MDATEEYVMGPAGPIEACRLPQRLSLRLDDGYRTSVCFHGPRGAGRRLPVLYVHGIQSHPGWFFGSAGHLADRGHAVYQVVRRGSGDNAAARGHANSARQLLDDVDAACRLVLEHARSGRLHLLGVSWGGKLLAAYASGGRELAAAAASLTLVAPGIAPRVDVSPGRKLAIAMALLAAPHRRFAIPLSDVELFTDNPTMREYLRNDPCRLHLATARFLYAGRQLDRMLRKAPQGALKMPTSLLLASCDRIIDNAATQRVLERLAGDKLRVRQFDGFHTLEFQLKPGPFYQALAEAMAHAE